MIVFITDDDVWSVPAEGGSARRVTADLLGVANPVVSPDSRVVAFTSEAQGQPEILRRARRRRYGQPPFVAGVDEPRRRHREPQDLVLDS